jgi:hypothetical protein
MPSPIRKPINPCWNLSFNCSSSTTARMHVDACVLAMIEGGLLLHIFELTQGLDCSPPHVSALIAERIADACGLSSNLLTFLFLLLRLPLGLALPLCRMGCEVSAFASIIRILIHSLLSPTHIHLRGAPAPSGRTFTIQHQIISWRTPWPACRGLWCCFLLLQSCALRFSPLRNSRVLFVHACIHTYMCVYYLYVCVYIYVYIYVHIYHTHTSCVYMPHADVCVCTHEHCVVICDLLCVDHIAMFV